MTKEVFEGLLRPILPVVFAYARRLTRGVVADAEDLLQEATISAWKGRHTFNSGTNFKAWFFKVLTHEHYRRVGKKTVDTRSLDDSPDAFLFEQVRKAGITGHETSPARVVLDQIENDQIREAISNLPDEFREASLLYFIAEMSYEEISEALDVPIGTVRSRLHRGRKLLQQALWDIALQRGLLRPNGASLS